MEREKVLKGLAACRMDPDWAEDCRKLDCPYCGEGSCVALLANDAYRLLMEQEPRVMTFAEVKKHYNLPSVFVDDLGLQEDYYQDIRPLYFEFPNPNEWEVHWRGANQVRTYLDEWEDRYNKTWRCWTSRPTDAQREAEPWGSG